MATLNPVSSFASFIVSEQEQLVGSIFTYEQKMNLQNQITNLAEQKIALEPDPLSYATFIQTNAYLSGQIAPLRYALV